jgi:hypothetical protein
MNDPIFSKIVGWNAPAYPTIIVHISHFARHGPAYYVKNLPIVICGTRNIPTQCRTIRHGLMQALGMAEPICPMSLYGVKQQHESHLLGGQKAKVCATTKHMPPPVAARVTPCAIASVTASLFTILNTDYV